MGLIATTIEAIVDSLTTTTTYVRASKLAEANLKLTQIDIVTNPIALYYNLPIIPTEVVSSGTVEVHPVKIAFLAKSNPDNTAVQDDVLRDAMKVSAVEFYQSLVTNYSSVFEQFQGYELDPTVTGEKVFGEVMTGYTLTVEIRFLSNCSAVSVVGTVVDPDNNTITTVNPGGTAIVSLQDVWDVSADARKNTFVGANDVEIAKFLFSDTAKTALDFYTGLVLGEVLALGKFFDSQIDSGNFALWDDWAHLGLQTEANSLIKALTGNSMTAVNSPTHTPGTGFNLNGSTQYINTGHNPSTFGGNYSLNDALIGAFIISEDTIGATRVAVGAVSDGTNQANISMNAANESRVILNSSGTGGTEDANTINNSLFVGVRTSSTVLRVYFDGVGQTEGSQASVIIPNTNLYIGARNNDPAPTQLWDGAFSSFIIGAAVGFDHQDYNDNLVILNTELAAI